MLVYIGKIKVHKIVSKKDAAKTNKEGSIVAIMAVDGIFSLDIIDICKFSLRYCGKNPLT